MKNKLTIFLAFVFSNLLFASATFAANDEVENILTLEKSPSGVVFEIVTGSSNSLKWALPQVQQYIKKIRTRFPKIEIAIVTHGKEQFALKTNNNKKYKKVHSLTQQLVKSSNVQLHVCGTYAQWNNVSEEEFPNYVDVTAEGPATINDYISLGYLLIKI